jgi:hypothetical protein
MSVGLEFGLRAQILYDFPEVEPGAAIAKHSRSET